MVELKERKRFTSFKVNGGYLFEGDKVIYEGQLWEVQMSVSMDDDEKEVEMGHPNGWVIAIEGFMETAGGKPIPCKDEVPLCNGSFRRRMKKV